MTNYCVELGDAGEATVHEVACGSYDLASLLGQGRISRLGEFSSSSGALRAAKTGFPGAESCPDCCGLKVAARRISPAPAIKDVYALLQHERDTSEPVRQLRAR